MNQMRAHASVNCAASCHMSSDTNARSVKLSATGEARLKAAAAHCRRAQKEFETAVGAADGANLRTVLQRVISVT